MSDAAKISSEFIKENKNEELKGGWFDTQEEYDQFKVRMTHQMRSSFTPEDWMKYGRSMDGVEMRNSLSNAGTAAYDVGSIGNSEMNEMLKSLRMGEINKPLAERYFGKMDKGSLRGSILGMTCAAIGSGVLTFPYVYKQIGWVNGTVILFMGAFGCWWSLYMLI